MIYFYARVSSRDQSLARQLKAAQGYKHVDKVFEEKQSGKDLNRPVYQTMKQALAEGDEVVVHALDRLGRNKEDIKNEIAWFKQNGITLRVLDLPTTLIDFQGQDWIGDMVTNILVEVLASVAQNEREKIRQRQMEGIAALRESDNWEKYGRPRKAATDFEKFLKRQKGGELTVDECCRELGISRTTYYARAREAI